MKPAVSRLLIVSMIACLGLFQGNSAFAQDPADLLFTLPVPEAESQRRYLGLTDEGRFSLGQIQADIVIIEIFSMYCPICQREAKDVNVLYSLIKKDPLLRNKVKLIGIGAGNSAFEVNFFKETYAIEFPLFSDPEFIIHKQIGQVGTPHFFGLSLQGNGTFTVFYSRSGEIPEPEEFLTTLLTAAKEKQKP